VFDTIILLTGAAEHPVLAPALQAHNPQLTILAVETLADIEAVESQLLRRARLVAFVTDVVVAPGILDQVGYGAYGFHPGPPHYPGWRPAHFAVHDRAAEFGATAHVLIERVDAGPIVGVELFNVPPRITAAGLEELAYAELARLFWRLAQPLATQIEPLSTLPIRWSGPKCSRRTFAARFGIPLNIPEDEFDRRVVEIARGG
jgi:methionyl-tRNA formyltransferase